MSLPIRNTASRTMALSLAALAVLALAALAVPTQAGLAPGDWPVSLTYTVTDESSGRVETSTRSLVADGWTQWKDTVTCCGATVGMVTELRPGGEFWTGGLPGLPVSFVSLSDDPAGMVPLAEFAPRYPSDPGLLSSEAFVHAVSFAQLASLPDEVLQLRIPAELLVAYEVRRIGKTDAGEVELVDFRVVYRPLNIPVYSEQSVDGITTRTFSVDSIEFLPEDFEIPFGQWSVAEIA